ncbi:PqqD family protein [Streptomyces sp. NPDC059851]|uniref:PqqD family protein n=1 Tax=Streptomyces sp. NPDC059851 TaxID=3346971 RepID=UPI0036638D2F
MTTTPAADAVPRPTPETRFRKFRGKLLAANGPHALELSESAAFILQNVDGSRSAGRIGELLAAEYGIGTEEATADVLELLAELAEADIIDMGSA